MFFWHSVFKSTKLSQLLHSGQCSNSLNIVQSDLQVSQTFKWLVFQIKRLYCFSVSSMTLIGCGLLTFVAELSTSLILYIALCPGLSWCHAHKEKHSRLYAWQFLLFWLCLVVPTTCVTYLVVTQWAGNFCWARAESCLGKIAPLLHPSFGVWKISLCVCVAFRWSLALPGILAWTQG